MVHGAAPDPPVISRLTSVNEKVLVVHRVDRDLAVFLCVSVRDEIIMTNFRNLPFFREACFCVTVLPF